MYKRNSGCIASDHTCGMDSSARSAGAFITTLSEPMMQMRQPIQPR